MKRCLPILLLPLLLTGCGSEGFADRMYTRAIGLHGNVQMSVQGFEQEGCTVVDARSIGEALQYEEAAAGGKVFVGHTELLCLDGTCNADAPQELFTGEGISPGCKVLYAHPTAFLRAHDAAETVHTLRMAERDGLLPRTDLSTVLEEWQGIQQTALVPAEGGRSMVLLKRDGHVTALSAEACAGLRCLRHGNSLPSVTLDDGSEVAVTSAKLRRTAENGAVCYTVTLRTDAAPGQRRLLQEQMQTGCETAVREMLAAGADVIGVQEVCEKYGIPADPLPEVQVKVEVR
ncbi:MAG: hypothetical protein K5695_16945 [Oscillospiraceae bacterium]|nr:hypothetical protein [Oscillospiraceae bacterium]